MDLLFLFYLNHPPIPKKKTRASRIAFQDKKQEKRNDATYGLHVALSLVPCAREATASLFSIIIISLPRVTRAFVVNAIDRNQNNTFWNTNDRGSLFFKKKKVLFLLFLDARCLSLSPCPSLLAWDRLSVSLRLPLSVSLDLSQSFSLSLSLSVFHSLTIHERRDKERERGYETKGWTGGSSPDAWTSETCLREKERDVWNGTRSKEKTCTSIVLSCIARSTSSSSMKYKGMMLDPRVVRVSGTDPKGKEVSLVLVPIEEKGLGSFSSFAWNKVSHSSSAHTSSSGLWRRFL